MSTNILKIVASVGYKSFGVGPVALNLCSEQNKLGAQSSIWCLDSNNELNDVLKNYELPKNLIHNYKKNGPSCLGLSFEMERNANFAECKNIDVIHQHGIWTTSVSRSTNILRKKFGIPTVIAPHGSLERTALNKKRSKKYMGLFLFEKNNLVNASCLHACSEQEISSFRDFGLKGPVAVIPNGISRYWLESDGDSCVFRERFNVSPNTKILFFLSRISPIKGLLLLLDAISLVREHFEGWVLVIAGSDEFNHKSEVVNKIHGLCLDRYVIFTGMLVGQEKRDAFASADIFILPTIREAAPLVVLEALGAGVPVFTTKGAPWAKLLDYKCGWWVDVTVNAIADGLKEALSRSPEELMLMGRRGVDLVSRDYTWTSSAFMSIELYDWLLGHRGRPDYVVID